MKKLSLIPFILLLFNCTDIKTIGAEKNIVLIGLEIPSFDMDFKKNNEQIILRITDSLNYYNEVLLNQKLELALLPFLKEMDTTNTLKILLSMPKRDEILVNYEMEALNLASILKNRYQNIEYSNFIQKLVNRINKKGNFREIDRINTALQMIISPNSKENWYGINSLDYFYSKFSGENSEFDAVFNELETYFVESNVSDSLTTREIAKFLKENIY